jgi:hypothetical protein
VTSIWAVTSDDAARASFGTAWVIAVERVGSFLVTCAHVVRDVGGVDHVRINGLSTRVLDLGDPDGATDLAVLYTPGLNGSPLAVSLPGDTESEVEITGYLLFTRDIRKKKTLRATLGQRVELEDRSRGKLAAWEFTMAAEHKLAPGFSGAPVTSDAAVFAWTSAPSSRCRSLPSCAMYSSRSGTLVYPWSRRNRPIGIIATYPRRGSPS